MSKTPYERWQERTDDGRKLPNGWTHRKHNPPCIGEYEVKCGGWRQTARMTYAYGSWWWFEERHDPDEPLARLGEWHRAPERYDWRGEGRSISRCSDWGDVVKAAATLKDPDAMQDMKHVDPFWGYWQGPR